MAEHRFSANTGLTRFSLRSTKQARTVIVPDLDQSYIPQYKGGSVRGADPTAHSIPQVYYAEDVMPTQTGYQSVGYSTFIALNASIPELQNAHPLKDTSGNVGLIAKEVAGLRVYVLEKGDTTWTLKLTLGAGNEGKRLTVAHVSGTSYVYIQNVGCYVYNFGAGTLGSQTLTGLTAADILGITTTVGYLLAYSTTEIAWSSLLDPTDFVPSLETGAGGGGIEALKGDIVTAVAHFGGFMLLSTSNALSATYANNTRYPFNFSEVTGAGGLVNADYIVETEALGVIYAYTTSGLQSISARQATPVYTDITDFLSGGFIERFNSVVNTLTTTPVIGILRKKFAFVADRFLCISYGEEEFEYVLVVDIVLKMYGKLKVAHTEVFELELYDQDQYEVPKKSIGILQDEGKVITVNFDTEHSADGVILYGKYQQRRANMMGLQYVELENVTQNDTADVFDVASLDGKNPSTPVSGYKEHTGTLHKTTFDGVVGMNHSILVKGTFDITTLVLGFTNEGEI